MRKPLELLSAHLDGEQLTAGEARRLSVWVGEHPDNAQLVVEMGMIHELTDSMLSVPRLLEELSLSNDPAVKRSIGASLDWIEARPAAGASAAQPAGRPATGMRWMAASGLLLAASLLLAVTTLVWRSGERDSSHTEVQLAVASPAPPAVTPTAEPEPVVATVIGAFDVVWDDPRTACRGMHLRQQTPVRVSEGVLAVTTPSGCDIVIQGPATFAFETVNRVRLDAGRLTARVSGAARELVVLTPTARVIDLGTEFGVRVGDSNETSVAVYEGVVELTSRNATADSAELQTRTLQAGRAGFVDAQGKLRWTIETLPHEREFIRPDEIAALHDAQRGSRQAAEQVCFYELQRIEGLLGFQAFDIPSDAGGYRLAFTDPPLRSKEPPHFERDLAPGRMRSSGSLRVGESSPVFLSLDTKPTSALARAGLLTDRGTVGRSDTELWLSWRTQATDGRRPGAYAGLSIMFGDDRQFHEPLFLGTASGNDRLGVVANVGSHAFRRNLVTSGDEVRLDEQPHRWLLRMVFAERADKAAVWCDLPASEAAKTRPHAEVLNANIMFDRIRLGVGAGGEPWLFDDLIIATRPEAIDEAVRLIAGD